MADDLRERLDRTHPDYAARLSRWRPCRAFSSVFRSDEEKKEWLPQGSTEDDQTYAFRLRRSVNIGLSRPALRRMVGALTKKPLVRTYAKGSSAAAPAVQQKLEAFDANADGRGSSVDKVLARGLREALTVGYHLLRVDAPASPPEASLAAKPLPFVERWKAEELIDWQIGSDGRFEWVKLRRDVRTQEGPLDPVKRERVWLVIDRTKLAEYRLDLGDDKASVVSKPQVAHNLGRTPVVPLYGWKEEAALEASPYIEDLAQADMRKFAEDSDQALASGLHASPRLVIETTRDLAEIAADTSRVVKLNPEKGEKAQYLELNASGMEARETLIERTAAEARNAAGLEANEGETAGARSGVAIAYAFSAAEEPTLNAFADSLEEADQELHRIVALFVAPAPAATPEREAPRAVGQTQAAEPIVGYSARHPREWDLMSTDRAIEAISTAWPTVKSPTWRKASALHLAQQIPGSLPAETLAAVRKEIEAADYDAPAPAVPEPGAVADGQFDDGQ